MYINLIIKIYLHFKLKMILRNGKMFGLDKVTIDFDYASRMWRSNKIKWGQGHFRYSN